MLMDYIATTGNGIHCNYGEYRDKVLQHRVPLVTYFAMMSNLLEQYASEILCNSMEYLDLRCNLSP